MALMGRYRIRRKLGEGGMGSVMLADDERGRLVVLKVPHQLSEEVTARMRDEAELGFQLRHPHIVRTLDFFMDGQRPVIVIEHIDGTSLRDLRDRVGALPPAMVARVGEQISDALSALHHLKDNEGRSLEILHRDVTPGNIIIDRAGHARLIDLGIARSVMSQATKTAIGVLRGTFRYLSPDLFAGRPYSWMTDLWALGVTLFEASVGRKAAEGNEHAVFDDIIHGRIAALNPDEQLHPALRYLFDGLLVVNPEERRFRDPEDVLHAFRVIRGRLGDGEQEAVVIMSGVPLVVDDDDGPTEIAQAPPPPVTDLSDVHVPASVLGLSGPIQPPVPRLAGDADDPDVPSPLWEPTVDALSKATTAAMSGSDTHGLEEKPIDIDLHSDEPGFEIDDADADADADADDVDVDVDDFDEETLASAIDGRTENEQPATPGPIIYDDETVQTAVNVPIPQALPTVSGGLSQSSERRLEPAADVDAADQPPRRPRR